MQNHHHRAHTNTYKQTNLVNGWPGGLTI